MSVLALSASRSRMADLFILTKVRVNALVVATTAGGYYLGATGGIDLVALIVIHILTPRMEPAKL